MEEEARTALREELRVTELSFPFLVLVVAATVASFLALLLQRSSVAQAVRRGESPSGEEREKIFSIRRWAGAVIVGTLGFFLCLNLSLAQQLGEGAGEAAVRSAKTNVWASVLALCAAILRFFDLEAVHAAGQGTLAGEEDILPE